MKKVEFFFRSIFLKFCMQVPMTSIIAYIKSKNPPRMATLTYSHFGNPSRSHPCAHYTIVHKKALVMLSFFYIIVRNHASARECKLSGRGARRLAAPCFPRRVFWLYICIYRSHRYLHAKFQKDWPEKKTRLFLFKAVVHCFCCRLYMQDAALFHARLALYVRAGTVPSRLKGDY